MAEQTQVDDSLEPVRTPTQEDILFFAGFYEGEGSVTCAKANAAFKVTVCQKDPEMLYRMRDLWGGSIRFISKRGTGPSDAFTGYESWSNPLYRWNVCGDRGRMFLKVIYPYLSNRRKAQIDRISLTLTGRLARKSPHMSPERAERRAQMNAHEKYLESKAFHRAQNLEHCRAKDREFQRQKFGHTPRKGTELVISTVQ
jgi:hypothetical protein